MTSLPVPICPGSISRSEPLFFFFSNKTDRFFSPHGRYRTDLSMRFMRRVFFDSTGPANDRRMWRGFPNGLPGGPPPCGVILLVSPDFDFLFPADPDFSSFQLRFILRQFSFYSLFTPCPQLVPNPYGKFSFFLLAIGPCVLLWTRHGFCLMT